MKTFVTRIAGIVLLLVAIVAQPGAIGSLGRIVWVTVASLLFSGAMICLPGPARIYVLSTVVVVNAVFPLVVLFAIGQPTYGAAHLVGQFAEFTSKLVSALSGHYIEAAAAFLLPVIACAASLRTFERLAPSRSERLHASA